MILQPILLLFNLRLELFSCRERRGSREGGNVERNSQISTEVARFHHNNPIFQLYIRHINTITHYITQLKRNQWVTTWILLQEYIIRCMIIQIKRKQVQEETPGIKTYIANTKTINIIQPFTNNKQPCIQ